MMAQATLGRQGRVVIPASVRKELGLATGDRLSFTVTNGTAVMQPQPSPEQAAQRLRGLIPPAKGTSMTDELIAERRAEAARS